MICRMKGWGRHTWSSSPVKLNSFFLSPLKVYFPHQSFIQSRGSNAWYYLFADAVSLAHRGICYRGIVGWNWQGTFHEWNVVMQESRWEAIEDWGNQRQFAVEWEGWREEVVEMHPRTVKKSVTRGDPPPRPHPKGNHKTSERREGTGRVWASWQSRVDWERYRSKLYPNSQWLAHIWMTGAFLCSLCVYPDSALIQHFHLLLRKFAASNSL